MLAHLLVCSRQFRGDRNFHSHLLCLDNEAQTHWDLFRRSACQSKQDAPDFCHGAAGKHCFTTTSHVLASHLLSCAFRRPAEERSNVHLLMGADQHYLESLYSRNPPDQWAFVSADSILAAPEHLAHMAFSMINIVSRQRRAIGC